MQLIATFPLQLLRELLIVMTEYVLNGCSYIPQEDRQQ